MEGGERIYEGPSRTTTRSTSGTIVHVRDLFYKWPVRRKQAESSSTYRNSTISQIRKGIEALAIINSHVAFTLYDMERQDDAANSGRILAIPRTDSIVGAFGTIYGRSFTKDAMVLDQEDAEYRLLGFLSPASSHSKQCQLIYVNDRPIATCELHRRINHLFARTAFARISELDARVNDQEVSTGKTRPSTESPRKNIDRYPVFCLNLTLPADKVDIGLEPTKRLVHFKEENRVLNLVDTAVKAFLLQQGLIVPALEKPVESRETLQALQTPSPSPTKKHKPSKLFAQPDIFVYPTLPSDDDNPHYELVDPYSGQKFIVDKRTGNSWAAPVDPSTANIDRLPFNCLNLDRKALRRTEEPQETAEDSGHTGGAFPAWLNKALEGWSNPVFQPAKKAIPSIATSQPIGSQKHNSDPNNLSSISKEDIRDLNFIAQVDQKFLLCRSLTEDQDLLILVDQHAADERIRVESLLKQLHMQVTTSIVEQIALQERKAILLTAIEVEQVADLRDDLARWGFRVTIPDQSSSDEYGQVYVHSVPAILADRLSSETALLQRLLQRYICQPFSSGIKAGLAGPQSWCSALRKCPEVMVDLINSKACRGAVMFNDKLEAAESQDLLTRLAQTDFPFICAHGRPSMIPIVALPASNARKTKSTEMTWPMLPHLVASQSNLE